MGKSIGILATGNEIVEGETINTNASTMARHLTHHGIDVKCHFAVSDDKEDIKKIFSLLVEQVDGVISIGGLGPTSDDVTRFALAESLELNLVFYQKAWQVVVDRHNKLNHPIHESNRNQALFPEHATIFENLHGTACGGQFSAKDTTVFMLPGPPSECLPMFMQDVLPSLVEHGYVSDKKIVYWRLIGVIEAEIAANLDAMAAEYQLATGYRVSYPYLETKLIGKREQFTPKVFEKFNQFLAPFFVTTQDRNAFSIFTKLSEQLPLPLIIHDEATGGLFYASLIKPTTIHQIFDENQFEPERETICLSIKGLEKFWAGLPPGGKEHLSVEVSCLQQEYHYSYSIAYRDRHIRTTAMEYVCYALLKTLGLHYPEFQQALPA